MKTLNLNIPSSYNVYPWQYSLLDASNKETVIYQAFVNKDNQIPCKTPALVNNDTWEELYCTYYNQTEMSKQYVLLYPVEFHSSQYASWRVNAQGDWVKSYKVFDHLGSLRVDGVGYGNAEQTYYDYKPFGGLEASGTNIPFGKAKTRLGYVDMPKDKESNLGDHGVRKYDTEVGRFLAIDPLWEKYHTLNPFQYSGNSPVMMLDRNGFAYSPDEYAVRQYLESQCNLINEMDASFKAFSDEISSNMSMMYDRYIRDYVPNTIGFNISGSMALRIGLAPSFDVKFRGFQDGSKMLQIGYSTNVTTNIHGREINAEGVFGYYFNPNGSSLNAESYYQITKNPGLNGSVSLFGYSAGISEYSNNNIWLGEGKIGRVFGDKNPSLSAQIDKFDFNFSILLNSQNQVLGVKW